MKAAEILCCEKQLLFFLKKNQFFFKYDARKREWLGRRYSLSDKGKCKNFKAYKIATDESTDVKDVAKRSVFVGGGGEVTVELCALGTYSCSNK